MFENLNLNLRLSEDDSYFISVNDDIEVVLKRNNVGYSIDVYSHRSAELMYTAAIWDDDINEEEE